MSQRLAGAHVLSVKQFDRELLDDVFTVARSMRVLVRSVATADLLKGRVLTNLFYEPSTRTSSSFAAAILRLGGSVVPINDVHYSSVTKGETLEDTVRTLEAYGDALVLRHPELGAAARAAAVARKPVINAGDGPGEHPTQALLDLFTILTEKLGNEPGAGATAGTLGGLRVALVGDLRHGRTVHSLARLLALYGAELHYVSPELLRMPEALVRELGAAGARQREHRELGEILGALDVLYVTRVQKERFALLDEYERVKDAYVITPAIMTAASQHLTLMHPFPRVTEIDRAVDADPRAAYFRQMENGLFVRMALLAMVFGRAG